MTPMMKTEECGIRFFSVNSPIARTNIANRATCNRLDAKLGVGDASPGENIAKYAKIGNENKAPPHLNRFATISQTD